MDMLCPDSRLLQDTATNLNKNGLTHCDSIQPQGILAKENRCHLVNSLSAGSSLEPSLINNTLPQDVDSEILQATTHAHSSINHAASAFQIPIQTSPFTTNCGVTSVPNWLSNSFFKTSSASLDILPPVADICPAFRNNGFRILGLGHEPEIASSNNTAHLGTDSGVSLITEAVKIIEANSSKSVSQHLNELASSSSPIITGSKRIISDNSKQYTISTTDGDKSSPNMSQSQPISVNLCLNPTQSTLLQLSLNEVSAGSSQSETVFISGSESNTCDLLNKGSKANQLPLPSVNTLIHNNSLNIHSYENHVPTPPSFLPVSNGLSSSADISISTVSSSSNYSSTISNANSTSANSCAFSEAPSVSSNGEISSQIVNSLSLLSSLNNECLTAVENFNSFIEESRCFKCKICSFISLNKIQVALHIKQIHGKSQDTQLSSNSSLDINNSTNTAHCQNTCRAEHNDESLPLYSNASSSTCHLETEQNLLASDNIFVKSGSILKQPDNRFYCEKCKSMFSTLKDCKRHIINDHNMKFNRGAIENAENTLHPEKQINSSQSSNVDLEVEISDKNTDTLINLIQENNYPNEYGVPHRNSSQKVSKKTGKKKNLENQSITNGHKKKGEMSFHQKAWQKKKVREQGTYICEFKGCNVRFRVLDNLEYHRKSHILGRSAFACPECPHQSENWGSLAGHLWRVHTIDMELHACSQCSFRTYSLSKLENLHKRIHREERPYLCDTCGKGFKTSKQLRTHQSIHFKKKMNHYKSGECSVCFKRFTDNRMLRIHLDTVHNKLRPFLCNYCGYSASNKSTLKMHMRQHTGEKPFACNLCDYRTSDHNSLRRHKMRHSGEKPYKCPYCLYACIQSSTYKSHLKKKHPGQDQGLMFSCNLCTFRSIKHGIYLNHITDHHMSNTVPVSSPQLQCEPGTESLRLVEALDISLSNDQQILSTNNPSVNEVTNNLF